MQKHRSTRKHKKHILREQDAYSTKIFVIFAGIEKQKSVKDAIIIGSLGTIHFILQP